MRRPLLARAAARRRAQRQRLRIVAGESSPSLCSGSEHTVQQL